MSWHVLILYAKAIMSLSPQLDHLYVQIPEDLEQNESIVPGIVRDPYPFISQSDIVHL